MTKTKLLLLATALLILLQTFPAHAQTTLPSPRTDPNSTLAHQQLVAKARAGGIDLYFLGDSITRRWGCTDPQWHDMLENWNQNFYGWNVANFGWGGDRIQNILWRIDNGELDNVNPKVIVVLAGTNDVGNHEKADGIVAAYQALLAAIHSKAPNAKIIITAIFPRNDHSGLNPEIEEINAKLENLTDGKTIFYITINDKLANPAGKLFPGMTVDKLHLTVKGYQIWADALRPLLTQLLGPRGSTDHAPPPTGDPSALSPPSPR